MNRVTILLLTTVLVGSLGGCRSLLKKRDSAESAAPIAAAPPPVATTAAPVPAAAPTVAVDDGAIPASQDYEDEAFAKVTAGTYKAEFARLKQEIEAK